MKISIIIPFYKGKFFLDDCLQSIKEQTYQDIEVILVCDHIEEDLDSLLEAYRNNFKLMLYYLGQKTGVAAARNLGLFYATGEYIYFLDSDDYLNYNTLEILVSAAESEKSEVIYGKTAKTWFTRHTYLINQKHSEEHAIDNEDNDSDSDEQDSDTSLQDMNFSLKSHASDSDSNRISWEIAADINSISDNRMNAYRYLVSHKKGIRNISVLNILIKRSLVTEFNIRFNENIIYLSDYPFLFQVLYHAASFKDQKDAVYIKRYHNDPINLPSLSQLYGSRNFDEFIQTYQYTIELPETDSDLRLMLDKKMIHYYVSGFAPKLHRNPNISELREHFNKMHTVLVQIDPVLLNQSRGYKKRLLKALKSGNFKKSTTIVKYHLALKKLKKIVKNKRELSKSLYLHIFLKKSMKKNWVLCESFFGKSYSDNPKYIYEYISGNYPDRYKFIWVIDKKHTKIPYKHISVKRFSIRYFYYLARCKYYIFNGRQPEWTRKREGNIFLQTWHGTPLKRLAFDMEDISSATARYKKQVYNQSRAWDYLIAPNQFTSDVFQSCFLFNNEMLKTGYPRNDILHTADRAQLAENIKRKLNIPLDKKSILYAPTWRDDEYYEKGKYKFSLQLDLTMLRKHLSDNYVILLRTHYFIADNLDITGMEGFVYNLSKYDDIAELYLISDLLITDYSSVFFDYANLMRPMLFFMYDLEKYRDVLRGFYIDIEEELPGPILTTTQEVLDVINNIDFINQKYYNKYTLFYDKYCSWEDGHAAERAVQRVFGLKGKRFGL